jgi:hypothetical protein
MELLLNERGEAIIEAKSVQDNLFIKALQYGEIKVVRAAKAKSNKIMGFAAGVEKEETAGFVPLRLIVKPK